MPIHLNQKFQLGDLVRLTTEIPSFMSHFPGWGELCVYAGSYQDKFGGTCDGDVRCTLLFPDRGEVSWYNESQLTLVKRGFLGQFVDAGNRFALEGQDGQSSV